MTTATENSVPAFGLIPTATLAGLDGLDALQGILHGKYPAPPANEIGGIRPLEVTDGRIVFEATPSARFYNTLGTVHGGWIAMLLDTAMGCAVHSRLKAGQAYTTLDMNVTFLRAVREQSGPLRCEGILLHAGGRVGSAVGKIFDGEGRLVAHGSENCVIFDATRKL